MSYTKKTTAPQKHDKEGTSSTTLAAVAFQDHLVRSLNLGAPVRIGPRQIGLGPAAKAKQKQKKEIKSQTDTGLRKTRPKGSAKKEDEEYVLDAKPVTLTLAQKMGLVEAPDQPLSEKEWQNMKLKSNERDDSKLPCVICKEDFGTQEQVLLSCSHVFHRACLQAFERFTGKKTCPMCRNEQYQTRVIHEGAKQHRIKCATRIQAAWRGYVVRCWYLKLRESVPPTDPKLRKKFYASKLSSITDRMLRSCDFNIDVFLTEIDENLAASRAVFRNFDATFNIMSEEQWEEVQLKAVMRQEVECPICLGALVLPGYMGDGPTFTTQELHNAMSNMSKLPDKTDTKKSLGLDKDPIISKLTSQSTNSTDHNCKPKAGLRKTVLLSCSHVFHETCLRTFEELACEERPICPVCRSLYQKRVISL
ncbi:RING finger protein 32-like [Saccostrea echinata]|uniref:RING finger protein 32-like n=1 Tax=Saccostrea echinata TaxID=191078 RepID=UPI002A813644|nr:RING finger protein 32-like [Saccostrea echinata]